MMLAILFSSLAAFASERTPDILSKVLDANEKVQMNSCMCDTAGASVAPSLDTSNKNLCSVIDSIVKEGHPDVFNPSNPYGMCAPQWRTGTPEWQTPEGMKRVQTYGTAAFQAVPRSEFVAKGHPLLSDSEKQSALARATTLRAESAEKCCGSDKACSNAMNSVTVRICSGDADSNPNALDWCEAVAGQYAYNSKQMAVLSLRLRNSLEISGLNNIRIQEITTEAQKTLGDDKIESFPDPLVGEVVLSPYANTDGAHFVSDTTYRHEYGHACSFIRRQLEARRNQPHASDAAMSFFQRMIPKCDIESAQIRNAFSPLLDRAGSNQHVFSCLLDLAQKSTDPDSSAYIPNSCQSNKIEEIMADAFSMYTGSAFPDAYPTRACHRLPSTKHGAPVDVLTCLLSGDAHFRKALKTKLECAKEKL